MTDNTQKITRLRGTQDIYGEDMRLFQEIEKTALLVFNRFGFSEIETPIMEEKSLFVRALGTETDVVKKEMYEFTDRSQTDVALRPEGTAGVVRAYLENSFDKNEGLSKLFYRGSMFRSERPQAGRLRQFHQIGVELLGTSSPYADVEAISALVRFLEETGIQGFELKLNNLGTFEERAAYKQKLKEYFKPHLKQMCEDCQARYEKNIFRMLDCKNPDCRKIIEKSPSIEKDLTEPSITHFKKVTDALTALGIQYRIDTHMVRGLDYYTKTVFEVTHSGLGSQDALGAGGRYDQLVKTFGGPEVGAVGFAVGVERLVMCLKNLSTAPAAETNSFFVATLGEAALFKGMQIVNDLRKNKLNVEMEFETKSLKSQLRQADKIKSRYVLILGDDEIQKNIFLMKDMQEKTQVEFKLNELIAICKEKGKKGNA